MCKQIFVALNIILIDMVTKSKWCMKHMICVNPEQLELEIICDSHKEELDFQHITKNSTKILPIIFHNKNSIDVPIKLSILHVRCLYYIISRTPKYHHITHAYTHIYLYI